ncbi:hypothetical protein GCM10011512_14110 [Tersicoccus solisilvae]|uniref:Acetone carboxylase n=1 Tax=Tersicoccus solisilvae TaxID=1882339 RepID=A0ABQ1P3P9_9MICC|nr:acetone carboxylase [Tersicoccus solisilvae]GGC88329.1 hypothetical protein GCM10011512_14110 [Tersicoccus solisilvae]
MTDLLGSLAGSGPRGPEGPDAPQCSRRGCRAAAAWRLRWNNPRIHPPERRKEWLACAEHRDWLQTYLTERGLWRETLPLTPGTGGGAGA